jgi:hypothetical protein
MNYKSGWVAMQYKNLFGVWPAKIDKDLVMPPVPALQEYLAKKRRNFLANRHIRSNYRRNQQ